MSMAIEGTVTNRRDRQDGGSTLNISVDRTPVIGEGEEVALLLREDAMMVHEISDDLRDYRRIISGIRLSRTRDAGATYQSIREWASYTMVGEMTTGALTSRLKKLQRLGLVEKRGDTYELTETGEWLSLLLRPMRPLVRRATGEGE